MEREESFGMEGCVEDRKRILRERLLESIDYSKESSDEEILDLIDEMLIRESREHPLSLQERGRLRRELFHAVRKLDVLQELVDDSGITEIMINGPDHIFIEQKGRLLESELHFESEEKLQDVIQQIVSDCNRTVNEASPIVDARLQNGARVNVVLNPVALNGPIVTIRRFPDKPITMEDLVSFGSVTDEVCAWLNRLVQAKYNIFISGGTGSGKTTFLNALSNYIPQEERIITIEDSAELQLTNIRNIVRMETRNANVDGCQEITIRDLIKTSLRMRPNGRMIKMRDYKRKERVSPSHTHSETTDLTISLRSEAVKFSKFSIRFLISTILSCALFS